MKVCSLESFKFFILRKKKEVRESTNIIWESCTWAWQPSIGMWHNVGTKCLLLGPWSVLLLCNYFIIGALICNHFHLKVNTHVNTPVMSCNYFPPRNNLFWAQTFTSYLSDIIDNIILLMGKRTLFFQIFEKEVIIS